MIKFENPTNGRFYYLNIESDMLDDYVLRIIRGGKSARITRVVAYRDQQAIYDAISRISKQRLRRGYTLIA